MKTKVLLLFAAMALCVSTCLAQSSDNEDEVVKIDKWNQQAYREGEILVKFKSSSTVQMRAPQRQAFRTTQDNVIDALFQEIGVDSVEQLMPRTGHKNVGRKVRAYNGSMIVVKDLSKLYRVTLRPENAPQIHEAIERLKADDEIEFAEPNYLVYAMALPYDTTIQVQDSATYVSEPLYSQQWGPAAINLPSLWNKPKKSSKRPVIAILDTGVDIDHPDLAANIWTNPAEANGVSGQDDDANGFVDDLHGWDFIDNHCVTGDYNGHGTHCAGIAAAVGNNGIGITGANPDALIMPVKVMQSNGSGDVATIIRGIDYAAANGADIISMSIGGYGYSAAEEQALERANINAILVAAAGNNGHDLSGNHCLSDAPMFPAAFSFVLGVEASNNSTGDLASYSNFDYDGPVFSTFGENQLYNYELRAPGTNIYSTFPGGRYKTLNGTSMACPLVAGAISRLIQCKEVISKEILFGDLIHTRNGNIDMLATYNLADADRHPELSIVTYQIVDSAGGDSDGRTDAGETIALYPILRNAWGQAENIRFWIKTGYEKQGDWVWDDTTLITHLQDTAYFDKPLSSYAKNISRNPWRMYINPNCADGRQINLTLFATCDNAEEVFFQRLTLTIENGVEIGGMITQDLTLYPNVHYLVTQNIGIAAGVTLTIKPGTILTFKEGAGISAAVPSYKTVRDTIAGRVANIQIPDFTTGGRVVAKGTPDSLIYLIPASSGGSNKISLSLHFWYGPNAGNASQYWYELFSDVNSEYKELMKYIGELGLFWEYVDISSFNSIQFDGVMMKNCIISKNGVNWNINNSGSKNLMYQCNYYDGRIPVGTSGSCHSFETNLADFRANPGGENDRRSSAHYGAIKSCNAYPFLFKARKFEESRQLYASEDATPRTITTMPNFYGTSKGSEVRKYIYDIDKGYYYGWIDISSMLSQPVSDAHGIVWKILVDGIDAQDAFDSLPPIGVGTHKCEVYFNRPMDISISPVVSFGIREPYTQHQVNQNASWSADSTIYTAYFTIDAKTVSDGYNTFRVFGAKDNEHFEVPEEDWRFHMEISATGSMSTGLMAEAGLGKVTLTWETDEEDFEDLLGYNIYRWTNDTIRWNRYYDSSCKCYVEAGWRIDTICVNSNLIDAQDTAFIDYDVIPGKDYYYIIRQMTTSLSSYDISNPVTARPLTAIKGDANGSMTVDVADIITEANYITLQNPQPFIFEAADVNSDNKVDVIDIVGTVNIILHPQANTNAITNSPAYYYVQNGILYVETDVVLGGVQLSLNGDSDEAVTPLDALNDFEKISLWQTDEDYLFLAYSMSGKTLGVGTHALLQIGDADITSLVLSDAQGHNVEAIPQASTALDGTKYMPNSRKYLENGHLYIQIGNTVYSASGQLIK